MQKQTEVTRVNMLHGTVKFQYDNGQSRALNDAESLEFQERYEICRRHFSCDAGRVKCHIANKYFH